MSNEVKVALLALLALGLAFWGYKFIRGKNVLNPSNAYLVEYERVDGLKVSTPVTLRGVRVGFVSDFQLRNEKVVVKLDLEPGIRIPKSTEVHIVPTSVMGALDVRLIFDKACNGEDCAKNGDYLEGKTLSLLAALAGPDELDNYAAVLEKSLINFLDSLNTKLLSDDVDNPISNSLRDLEGTMANLNSSSGRLDYILANSASDINGTLANLRAITSAIEKDGRMDRIMANADRFTGQLENIELQQTVQELKAAISGLKGTLEKADQAFDGVSGIVQKIESGDGTLSKLINDDVLYKNISRMSQNADTLFNDLEDRPYRYVPFKNRKKVLRYDRKDAELEEKNNG